MRRPNNVLVVGDAMLDKHVIGEVERISPEAPVPVVGTTDIMYTAGGAANVAVQVSVAAEKTVLLYKAIRGSQEREDELLRAILKGRHIKSKRLWMNSDESCFTIPVKTRVWAGSQQVCRVDTENTSPPTSTEREDWIQQILRTVRDEAITKVIFSDYDKGTLNDDMITRLAVVLKEYAALTILDPKRPSFPSVECLNVVKPNRKELLSTGLGTAQAVSSRMGDDTFVVMTQGDRPTVLAQNGCLVGGIPVNEAGNVVDVCGAGDVHCAVLTLAFDGTNIVDAIRAANAAASISVQHQGCYTLTEEEIQRCLENPTS